jgi:hypothetical protein
MIKEIKHTLAKTKTGFAFGSMEIISEIISPIVLQIPIEEHTAYFKSVFDKLQIIEIKKKAEFKEADIVPIYLWFAFFCVSSKFKTLFEDKLKGYWYDTNDPNYFIFLLDNEIDAFDLEKTVIVYNEQFPEKKYRYKYIEQEVFKTETENEFLFTIAEFYGLYFASLKFEKLIQENQISGLQFFKDLNIKRENGQEFDPFRRKKYDVDGNCLS